MNGKKERWNGIERQFRHARRAEAQGHHRSEHRQAGGDDDPFFLEINNELADKGFLVTSTEALITWARSGSLMFMTFGLACCAVEMIHISMPRYDSSGSALRRARRRASPTS